MNFHALKGWGGKDSINTVTHLGKLYLEDIMTLLALTERMEFSLFSLLFFFFFFNYNYLYLHGLSVNHHICKSVILNVSFASFYLALE